MPRFFLMAGTNILGGTAIMTGRDAEHVRVLRMRPGEDITICDGHGTDYRCRIVSAEKEQVEAEVVADGCCLVMRLVGLYCIGIHKPINNPQATATGMVSQYQAERFLAFGLTTHKG